MIVIDRPRNSGKTTMLLHYMAIRHDSVLISRTENSAQRAFNLSINLKLKLEPGRFFGMTSYVAMSLSQGPEDKTEVLVDDADYIIKCNPEMGYSILQMANIITVSKGD